MIILNFSNMYGIMVMGKWDESRYACHVMHYTLPGKK